MYKKISALLILLFALNVASVSFHPSAISAKEKTKVEQKKEEKTKSAFQKALETLAIPFAYVLHWFRVKLYGPINVGANYQLQIRKVYKPTSRPGFFIDDPKEKVMNIKILLPLLFYKGEKDLTSEDFEKSLRAGRKNIEKLIKKLPSENYKKAYRLAKKLQVREVKTKYGDMIELTDPAEAIPNGRDGFGLNAGHSKRPATSIFPYHLLNDFNLSYEEKLTDENEKAGKGYFELHQKIATYVYVYWEGKAKLELQFWIGMGAQFGNAGSNGMAYEFSKEQPDKMVEYKEYRGDRKLIFKKPGWHKIYMDKVSDISVL